MWWWKSMKTDMEIDSFVYKELQKLFMNEFINKIKAVLCYFHIVKESFIFIKLHSFGKKCNFKSFKVSQKYLNFINLFTLQVWEC